jgi:hypothetical protein
LPSEVVEIFIHRPQFIPERAQRTPESSAQVRKPQYGTAAGPNPRQKRKPPSLKERRNFRRPNHRTKKAGQGREYEHNTAQPGELVH